MATFSPNSDNQRHAAPMVYLSESLPSSYSETPVFPGNMMLYMNYLSSSGSCTDTLAGNSQPNSCNNIPPPVSDSVSIRPQQEILSSLGGSRIGEHDFHQWGNGRSEMTFMPPMGSATSLLQEVQNLQGQGLSLSLSTQVPTSMQLPSIEYQNPNSGGFSSFMSPNLSISGEGHGRSVSIRDNESSENKFPKNAEYMPPGFYSDPMKTDMSSYGMSTIARTIPNSKYLKAAQELLDEVVSVRKALKQQDSKKDQLQSPNEVDGGSKNGAPSNLQETVSNSPRELSAAERQDLQDKLTKLLSMLDEVDRRYKQYYHQMQIVASSFDVIAGCGAAKPYTALALQTISCHFRCLRDTITGQIRASRRSLGEQDVSENGKGVRISRLRYVDQHLRQQRALQQLGMMQQHAWRPQRGLPESSVSILRAWLFEHFLHPYPKDSDKSMLARQTGLTRSQVSNWFINARVRLWKPMVEEMYKEETGDTELESNSSSEAEPKATKGDISASEDRGQDLQQNATSAATDVEMVGSTVNNTFGGTETEYGLVQSNGEQRPGAEDGNFYPDTIVQSDGGSGRFMTTGASYRISELGSFGNGSGVSLTLGLKHFEGGNLPISVENHHSFVTMRGDDVYNTASSVGLQAADFGNSHLFHDFVA
ncbi:BEL1-like homeodomain protein 6 [Actinidia chinensis var. chinensis]|uniref:BEL1-like homeodomain protein 6 n=1 Tax=Actinidia chinensis var. chinensis TaxID=1590841 RepID=A0A2R6RHE9_ACTCC|nr:BEL1-like homeodomain protein 6 [Actinidia chinensis var. chinensis]